MGSRLLFAAALSAWSVVFLAQSAPTSLTSADDASAAAASAAMAVAEKPLIRTKRAEEILYGNHQNAPRVKKSDPVIVTSDDDVSTKTDDSNKEDAESLSAAMEEKDAERNQPIQDQPHNVEDVPGDVDDADYQRYDGQEASEESEALRKKRSVQTVMMTAENMADSSISRRTSLINRPVRAKRDLDYEDLRQLFQNSREDPYEDEGPERVYEVAPETDEDNEDEVEEQDRLGVVLPYKHEPRYERPTEKEELLRELVERKIEEDAKEKLLDYLLAAALASEAESTEREENDEDENIAETPGREDYDDQARELFAAPAVIKRNTLFPYSYEPYGGRWGAMVPGAKRSSNEYERLYRLAAALNADDDYEKK